MYLYEIMDEIAEKSAHTLSPESIIRKINQFQANLFRNYVNVPTYSLRDLQAGLNEYPLPRPIGTIIDVVVNGVSYPYSNLRQDSRSLYYYILDGTIGLSMTPENDSERGLVIFHKKAPMVLSINDIEAIPDLDENYHMLLVYGPLSDLLTGSQSQEYKGRYDELLREYMKANEPPENLQVKAVYSM